MSERSEQLRSELRTSLENISGDITLLQQKLEEMATKANDEEDAAWGELVSQAQAIASRVQDNAPPDTEPEEPEGSGTATP